MEKVVLVDIFNNEIGAMEKMEAHQKGMLHRAFSIIIFNNQNEMLLQKRAIEKYHSAGLWTNACCSHPYANQNLIEAAKTRLQFEMGFSTELKQIGSFIYKCQLENNLIEHEYDFVLEGVYNQNPEINVKEASDFKWMNLAELKHQIKLNPQEFTFWLKEIINKFY